MDLILYNGIVHTLDDETPKVSAVAVNEGRIMFAGNDAEILKLVDGKTKILNLHGKLVVPGFNDSHLHNVKYGIFADCCDLSDCASLEMLISQTKNYIAKKEIPTEQWVVGKGWNQDKFDVKSIPTREDLDKISKNHPIVLFRCCSHLLLANSKALEVLGIDEHTPQVDGGFFNVRTGEFREAAKELVQVSIKSYDVATLKRFIKRSCHDLLERGITSIQTDDFNMSTDFHNIVQAYSELAEAGELTVRVTQQCLSTDTNDLKNIMDSGIKDLNIGDFYRIGPIKILGDGSLGARSAAMRKPYSDDPQTKGILIHREDQLLAMIEMAHCGGFSTIVHSIGDDTVQKVIECFKKVTEKHAGQNLRHGIVHCQITDAEQIQAIKDADLLVYAQPIFLDYDLHIVEQRVGKELAETSYGFGQMVKNGIHMSMGTDAPVESFDPLSNIYCAVTRQDKKGFPVEGYYPEQRLTIEESIGAYTTESAYCFYEENVKGKIKPGYFADMTVLSKDIYQADPLEILSTKVEMTIVAGKVAYDGRGNQA